MLMQKKRKYIKALLLAGVCALAIPTLSNAAADYPSKPVRIVVGYQAGGPTDLLARVVAEKLQAALGQPFIVENKPGAASNIASLEVAKAAPDGYTLLMAAAPIATNQFLYKNQGFDVLKDFAPISQIMSAPSVLAVSAKLPLNTVDELIAYGRAHPGELSVASTGNGGTPHLAAEAFKQRTKLDLIHIPYKGQASAVNDVMAGHVSMYFITSLSAIPYLHAGNPKPLAVAALKRMPQLPDVPTMAEAGMDGFVAESWTGLLAPAGTPRPVVEKLHAAMMDIVRDAKVRKDLTDQGAVVVGSATPEDFTALIKSNVETWGAILKTANISTN